MSDPIDEWTAAAADARSWWNQEWARFPTIALDDDGMPNYWSVSPDTGVYGDDWNTGQALARDTVAQMQRFSEGSAAFRRIVRAMDLSSTVAQGFLTRIEDMLTHPDIYLDSLEPGALEAKMRGPATAGKNGE